MSKKRKLDKNRTLCDTDDLDLKNEYELLKRIEEHYKSLIGRLAPSAEEKLDFLSGVSFFFFFFFFFNFSSYTPPTPFFFFSLLFSFPCFRPYHGSLAVVPSCVCMFVSLVCLLILTPRVLYQQDVFVDTVRGDETFDSNIPVPKYEAHIPNTHLRQHCRRTTKRDFAVLDALAIRYEALLLSYDPKHPQSMELVQKDRRLIHFPYTINTRLKVDTVNLDMLLNSIPENLRNTVNDFLDDSGDHGDGEGDEEGTWLLCTRCWCLVDMKGCIVSEGEGGKLVRRVERKQMMLGIHGLLFLFFLLVISHTITYQRKVARQRLHFLPMNWVSFHIHIYPGNDAPFNLVSSIVFDFLYFRSPL